VVFYQIDYYVPTSAYALHVGLEVVGRKVVIYDAITTLSRVVNMPFGSDQKLVGGFVERFQALLDLG